MKTKTSASIRALCAAVILLCCTSFAFAADTLQDNRAYYTDYFDSSPAISVNYCDVSCEYADQYDVIGTLTNLDIFNGYPDGTFRPGKEMTKAEFITAMFKVLRLDIDTEAPCIYTEHGLPWATPFIETMRNRNLLYPLDLDTKKSPVISSTDTITYKAASAMILSTIAYKGTGNTYFDTAYAYNIDPFQMAYSMGLFDGMFVDDSWSDKPITRKTAAYMIYNTIKDLSRF